MNANEELITKFYTAFQQRDIKTMQDCYSDKATFNDPAFRNLNATEVRAMWEMLISSSKDMQVEFSQVSANDSHGSAHWDAHYTFSATGRKVLNRIDASFVLENGKIVQHIDHFDFHTWAKQSLGITGALLGWTSFLKNKVQKQARAKLTAYMTRK